MHQQSMAAGSDMQGLAGRQEGGWTEEVKLKINQEAEGVSLSIPPYFRRLDRINNEECPSIFMRPRRNRQAAVGVAPTPMIAAQAQQPPDHAGGGWTGGNVIVAAVGPYHHHRRSESSSPLVTHVKKCAIVKFLARPEFGLDTAAFLLWARDNDAGARRCYEHDSVTMAPERFAEMLLLDGCLLLFAVFLLRSSVREDRRPAELARSAEHGEEFIYLSADISLHMKQTKLDLLLLGNQIPFFVLAELHRLLHKTFFQGIVHSIQKLALSCFDDIRPSPSPSGDDGLAELHRRLHGTFFRGIAHSIRKLAPSCFDDIPAPAPVGSGDAGEGDEALSFPPTVHHLLHLFHWSRVPRGKHAVDTSSILLVEPESNLPCATWLEDSLVSFSKHAAAPDTLHIVFQRKMLGARGVLRVPALHIHGYSDHVFRNLIAFEQSHLRCGLGVTAYSICMARLLQSEADAKLLRKSGILAHTHETDEEIVELFRGLADEYRNTFYSSDLLALCKEVAAHQRSAAPKAVRWVVLQCFPRQTVTFFVILGAFISIATLINTIFSVYRFYHPVTH